MKIKINESYARDPYKFNIHEVAKQMVADGFFGQNMHDQQKCEAYILVAAYDPDIAEKLPPRGFSFWEVCEFKWREWKARRAFNRPPPPD
jgi:hypothetical protein